MKIFSLFLFFIAATAFGALPNPASTKYELNNSPFGQHVQLGTQLVDRTVHVIRAKYDFAVQGGAVGTVNLVNDEGKNAVIPPGAIITNCFLHVQTALQDALGGATVAFSTGIVGGDLVASASLTPSYSVSNRIKACVPVGTAATSIKIPDYTAGYTVSYTPSMQIGTAALVAGKVYVFIQYLISQ